MNIKEIPTAKNLCLTCTCKCRTIRATECSRYNRDESKLLESPKETTYIAVTEKHDAHYRSIEETGIEPIRVMELIASREIIPEPNRMLICLAQKHILRAGTKEDWIKDIEKAINYLHRSLTGEWIDS